MHPLILAFSPMGEKESQTGVPVDFAQRIADLHPPFLGRAAAFWALSFGRRSYCLVA